VSARRWLPPALWAALILVLTSIPSPPDAPGGIPHLDKVVHFVLYAGLAWLVTRALRTRTTKVLAFVVVAISMFAAVDEWHQQFFARDPGVPDWIADVLGASAGVLVALRVRRVETAL
jgi:VanZ family protein